MRRRSMVGTFLGCCLVLSVAAYASLVIQVTGGANQQAQAVTPPDAPAGTIVMYASTTPPAGWLLLDGSTFSSSTYPDLAALLGSTTLPDFRGRFVRGWSDTAALDPSGPRAPLTTQGDKVGTHAHDAAGMGTDLCAVAIQGVSCVALNSQGNWRLGATPDDGNLWFGGTTNYGTGIGAETRPVNITTAFIIKATPQATGLTAAEVDARIAAALAAATPSPSSTPTPTPTPTPSGAPSVTDSATPAGSGTPSPS